MNQIGHILEYKGHEPELVFNPMLQLRNIMKMKINFRAMTVRVKGQSELGGSSVLGFIQNTWFGGDIDMGFNGMLEFFAPLRIHTYIHTGCILFVVAF